ncbi:MAG: YcnI family protein [Actinomycetota bacterium]|nr:YcnI family protein [Actinomycetota bacterium]
MMQTTRVLGAAMAAVAATAMWAATAASAHVTVSASGATSGGSDQVITFRVPTESASASTVELSIQLPSNTPIASVLVAPHPGWTDSVATRKLTTPIHTDDGDITEAVSVISWRAVTAAQGIKPGQFDQFVIMAGKLPTSSSLTFRAVQTYSDATKVSWIEVAAPGSPAPDHPAPVLALAAGISPSPASLAPTAAAEQATSQTGVSQEEATAAIVLGALGFAVAALALVIVIRTRRGTSTV